MQALRRKLTTPTSTPTPESTWAATIGGAGSTFAAPLQNAAQAFYTSRNPRASINGYQAVGSGTGEADVLKKVVDWGGTDVPMQQKDIYKSEPSGDNYQVSQFLQVPIALGGVAIAYNVPGLKDKALVLNANCLAWIYSGQVEYWNSKVIQNLNKGVKLPHQRIVVVARGDSSGTTFIFTNFLHAAAPKAWPTLPSKSALTLPVGGIAGSGNAGVASDVQNTTDSIGYVEYSYLLLNPSLLRGVVAVVNKSGKAVQPSIAGVAAAAAARPAVSATGFSIVWQWGSKTYPISGLHLGGHLEAEPDERRRGDLAGQVPRLVVALGRHQRDHRRSRRGGAAGLRPASGQHPATGPHNAAAVRRLARPGVADHDGRLSQALSQRDTEQATMPEVTAAPPSAVRDELLTGERKRFSVKSDFAALGDPLRDLRPVRSHLRRVPAQCGRAVDPRLEALGASSSSRERRGTRARTPSGRSRSSPAPCRARPSPCSSPSRSGSAPPSPSSTCFPRK